MNELSEASNGSLALVTGGAGFIGSHTVGRLLDMGHSVVVLDNFSTGKRENLAVWQGHPALTVIEADVAQGIARWLPPSLGSVERIIHLAAQTSVVTSLEHPVDDITINCAATVRVLEFARKQGAKKVYESS